MTYVRAVQRTGDKANLLGLPIIGKPVNIEVATTLTNDCGEFHDGPSFFQANILNITEVHRMGITGDGVY